jgi:hypothetical protein
VIYSLVLTCRACGVEFYAWLRRVLTELPLRPPDAAIEDLMPFKFADRAPHQNTCWRSKTAPSARQSKLAGWQHYAPAGSTRHHVHRNRAYNDWALNQSCCQSVPVPMMRRTRKAQAAVPSMPTVMSQGLSDAIPRKCQRRPIDNEAV